MSALRNAAPRRTHLERSQPASRTRSHPLLEKHKDYALRARDHNLKKAKLKALREKAAGRNEDEFAFGMVGDKGKGKKGKRRLGNVGGIGGVVSDEGNRNGSGVKGRVLREQEVGKGLSTATVLLLKGQDAGYLRVVRDQVRKRRQRLAQSLQMVDGARAARDGDGALHVLGANGGEAAANDSDDDFAPANSTSKTNDPKKHTIFVDDSSAQKSFSAISHFSTDDSGLARAYNRPRLTETSSGHDAISSTSKPTPEQTTLKPSQLKKRAQHQQRQRRVLAALDTQERELATAERELDAQTAKMRGEVGSGGVNKAGVKWRVKGRKR